MDQMLIQGTEIQIKEYQGKRVVTFKDIDAVHQRKAGTASRNFNQNRSRFIDCAALGKDENFLTPKRKRNVRE